MTLLDMRSDTVGVIYFNGDNIQQEIFDDDGSCRDVTFVSSDRAGVAKLIGWFYKTYPSMTVADINGINIRPSKCSEFIKDMQATDSIHISGESSKDMIKHLQLFVCYEDEDSLFLEFTFFPGDIDEEKFDLPDFLNLLRYWRLTAGATEYYLRRENVSWK